VARLRRLDAELVRRGLARSRSHAAELVAAGRVTVSGTTAVKPATQVDPAVPVLVAADSDDPGYASRGGHKLAGALDALAARPVGAPRVVGRRCLDAGASTGGFTDVLLRRGAARVVAVDVGYGQLHWSLRTDDRVQALDRTNIRDLLPDQVAPAPELAVGDLSFISLRLVLPAIVRCCAQDADLLLMVKPQFEVGKDRLGPGGVVRDPGLRARAVLDVAAAARCEGLGVLDVVASPLPGPSGNVEYFLWMRQGVAAVDPELVERAVAEGPSGALPRGSRTTLDPQDTENPRETLPPRDGPGVQNGTAG
jgi:23S rRNA (cytidine1920-2'-O)/16S rRNA (cytidine1409-2'-O)-methyltransferase